MNSDLTPPPPPEEVTDIFSLSDQVLADRLSFIEEIGFGNWGSVWLCRPKHHSLHAQSKTHDIQVAVKLVHRSKTSKTTAARVRSLWNEMKIVRSFKHDPHPSIIPFHSFIITPSYALITMAYLPTLIPVEVDESRAKEWFRSLLSGVEFLHARGVVHNDIKPANILLSTQGIPVLVDFGFAEKYDKRSEKAFHSNLTYGTPEYISPERARGQPHDTRKSDVWSLGITFFEILIGRTPFEHSDGEQFLTKDDLEKYWTRTIRGKWVGEWKMSKGIERLLRRMIQPNADLRCTSASAMDDIYWGAEVGAKDGPPTHKKSASVAHAASPSLALDKDMSRLLDINMPWARSGSGLGLRKTSRAALASQGDKPSGKDKSAEDVSENKNKGAQNGTDDTARSRDQENKKADEVVSKLAERKKDGETAGAKTHARSQSQPKLIGGAGVGKSQIVPKKRGALHVFGNLSPVQSSPSDSPAPRPSSARTKHQDAGKENSRPAVARSPETTTTASVNVNIFSLGALKRKPLGPRQPSLRRLDGKRVIVEDGRSRENEVSSPKEGVKGPELLPGKLAGTGGKNQGRQAKNGVLGDVTAVKRNAENARGGSYLDVPGKKENERGPKPWKELDKENVSRPVKLEEKPAGVKVKENETRDATDTWGRRGKDSVRDRMREWERERERLREIDRLKEIGNERDESRPRSCSRGREQLLDNADKVDKYGLSREELHVSRNASHPFAAQIAEKGDLAQAVLVASRVSTHVVPIAKKSASGILDGAARPSTADSSIQTAENGLTSLKHSLVSSIDKGIRLYKSSTLGQFALYNAHSQSSDRLQSATRRRRSDSNDEKESWENILPDAESSLPDRARNNDKGNKSLDDTPDRMTLWMRNVDKVVEDARQNFATTSVMLTPITRLPLAPVSRSSSQNRTRDTSRSSRLPRRVLAANQIFVNDTDRQEPLSPGLTADQSALSAYVTASDSLLADVCDTGVLPSKSSMNAALVPPTNDAIPNGLKTPRKRRATISTQSPQSADRRGPLLSPDSDPKDPASPSRREKSKSQGNLIRHIQPVSQLELQLSKAPVSIPSPRLSTVLDRNLFIASPISAHSSPVAEEDESVNTMSKERSATFDDLTSSPFHVEPYPPRKLANEPMIMSSPDKRHVEGVYDRFLMATTGVKRVGRGYQSDNRGPVYNSAPSPDIKAAAHNHNFKIFNTARRAMPPPVSSEDQWKSASADEFGFLTCGAGIPRLSAREEAKNTAALVRRAIKAIVVPGKTVSKRLSRANI